MNVNPTSVD